MINEWWGNEQPIRSANLERLNIVDEPLKIPLEEVTEADIKGVKDDGASQKFMPACYTAFQTEL